MVTVQLDLSSTASSCGPIPIILRRQPPKLRYHHEDSARLQRIPLRTSMCGRFSSTHRTGSSDRRGKTSWVAQIIQRRRSARNVDYSSISYAWGEPEFSQTLEVRCDGDTSYLSITPNVDALLRRLRTLNVLHCLWIDAICLNQADEVEKAQQIPMMGRIFGKAKMVHIWVGLADRMTAKLFTFFEETCLLPEVKRGKWRHRLRFLRRKSLVAKTAYGDYAV